jgi:GT2 family glycosyltransferase
MGQHNKSRENIKLSVIVLFYFGERWVKTCIDSLENQSMSRASYEIILVDNGGSTPSTGNYSGLPNTKVLTYPQNLGFAGGNNRALSHAEGELVLLMNQDVMIHHSCLHELVSAFDRYPRAGVVSANMLMVSQNDRVSQDGPLPEITGQYKLTRLGYAQYLTRQSTNDLIAVDFVSGNALCFRKRILKDAGNFLFDARLGSYAEDLDFSLRLQQTAWDMLVHPRAVVYHYRDDAFAGQPLQQLKKLFHVSSNRLVVYYNNLPLAVFLLKLPALILGIPFKVARPDGARGFKLLHFLVALVCAPVIVAYFGLKLSQHD